MGLAYQVGNAVTLSYRREGFSHIKDRNAQRMEKCMRAGKVKVIFNSIPVELRKNSAVLEVNGKRQEIPNDFVWIFAGGEPPSAFLQKIGVALGMRDMTSEGSQEAKQAAATRGQLVNA